MQTYHARIPWLFASSIAFLAPIAFFLLAQGDTRGYVFLYSNVGIGLGLHSTLIGDALLHPPQLVGIRISAVYARTLRRRVIGSWLLGALLIEVSGVFAWTRGPFSLQSGALFAVGICIPLLGTRPIVTILEERIEDSSEKE